jgi:Amt family ammonium transporter
MLATGLFATLAVNPVAANGLLNGNPGQLGRQAIAAFTAMAFVAIGTFVVAKVVSLLTRGLRAPEEDEEVGLDVTEHGEAGYASDGGMPTYSMPLEAVS